MNLLFLRGQVPTDRDPEEIVFDSIKECDDVWTQLAYAMTHEEDNAELWYWGGDRAHKFSSNFIERWVPSFKNTYSDFTPTVIFCRGGFLEYHTILKRFPDAIKIYYGAGRRYMPQPGFIDYNLILVDSQKQLEVIRKSVIFNNSMSSLFIKPAADNIFYPVKSKKEYDVCFIGNGSQFKLKNHKFIYETVPSDIKLLNLGNKSPIAYPSNVTSYRVLRSDMRNHICKCKMGIVATGAVDSCPRIIPELLSCGLPIVVLDSVHFWKEKYITKGTGAVANTTNFWPTVRGVLSNYNKYHAREYYVNTLSLGYAAMFIRNLITN